MKIVFMGTPDFAVPTLQALAGSGHDIVAVYTQPPRASGRGQSPRPTPVHRSATELGLEVRTPRSLRNADDQKALSALAVDAAAVVAYGLILPEPVLNAPRHGSFNVHASLLPRWRGAAPIQRAIMAGDAETGVCIMRMDKGLDTGPVCLSERVPIVDGMTAGELHDRLAALGAPLMCKALEELQSGRLDCSDQPSDGAIYAEKISKSEAKIDFTRPARVVLRTIHGLSPFPGAWFEAGQVRIKILKAEPVQANGRPGEVLDNQLTIACSDGAIRPTLLQRAGKGAMNRSDFQRGFDLPPGAILHRV